MGGLICLAYNLDDRLRPEALVLSAPAIDADVPIALRAVARILGKVIPGAKLPSTIKGEDLSRDPAVGAAYFADPLVHTKGTARFGVEFMDKMRQVQKSLGTLDVPTLVIHGTADPIVPPGVSAPLAAVASVDRKLFPGFRHELHNEPNADEVLTHVLGWLRTKVEAAHTEA